MSNQISHPTEPLQVVRVEVGNNGYVVETDYKAIYPNEKFDCHTAETAIEQESRVHLEEAFRRAQKNREPEHAGSVED